MGTTLHALVEVHQDGIPEYSVPPNWTDVATWDLGKVYGMMMGLRDAIERGWPKDPSYEALRLQEECIADTGYMWCEREFLPDLAELEEGWERESYAALRASVAPFTAPVRVLFWTL